MEITEFSAKQRRAFFNALSSAYPSYASLNVMLQLQLNEALPGIAAPGPLPEVVIALLTWAEATGRIDELLSGAVTQNPRNPRLRALGYEMFLNVPAADQLQSIVRPHVPMQDPVGWRTEMERLETSVCRIEIPGGTAAGSGFLVADDLVMTNCHVVREMEARGISPGQCVARFGYLRSSEGSDQVGEPFAFAAEWLQDSSSVEELDYAIVRLAQRPGRAIVPAPLPHEFRLGDIYFILQHPLGDPMKFSAGVFERLDTATRRVSYTANTQGGSSGSPVFDIGWKPVALHRAGGAEANSGIVLSAVGGNGRVPELWRPRA